MVNTKKINTQVFVSFCHTLVTMFVVSVLMLALGFFLSRIMSLRVFMGVVLFGFLFTKVIFWFSKIIVVKIFGMKKAKREEYPHFFKAVEKLRKKRKMIFAPDLYILDMKVPNACAFGPGVAWGFLGKAIAITPQMYKIANKEELEFVVAHEYAHLCCWDIGISTTLELITSGSKLISAYLMMGRTILGRTPIGYLVAGLVLALTSFLFPICAAAMSQEREKVADALAAKYTEKPESGVSIFLKLKLESVKEGKVKKSFMDGIMLSHPDMGMRIDLLKEYATN